MPVTPTTRSNIPPAQPRITSAAAEVTPKIVRDTPAPANPLYQQFADARALIGHVASGALVVAGMGGPPGLGKTHLAERVLIERGYKLWDGDGEPTSKSYIVFVGTVAALIQVAYRMRHGGVIVLDDADSLFLEGGLDGVNVMKQLLLDKAVRMVRHFTKEALKGEEQDETLAPTQFPTAVRFIVCTNDSFGEVSARMRPHIAALQSRGLQLVRLSANPRDHLDYTLDLILEHDLFLSPQATREGRHTNLKGAQEIADWRRERGYYPVAGPTPRTALDAAKMRRLEPEHWRRIMEREIRTEPLLPASGIPPRRVLVPSRERPGYVRKIASLATENRRRQREAAQ